MTPARRPTLPAVLLLVPILLAAVAASAQDAGQLGVHAADGLVRGDYTRGEDRVAFSAERRDDGRTVALIDVNGIVFDATYDPAGLTVRLDGHGVKLPVAERDVLRSLVAELERRWDPYRASLPTEEHLAFRLLLFLSEAPASFVFDDMTIEAPAGWSPGGRGDAGTPLGCDDQDDDDDTFVDCAPHVGQVCYDACDEDCTPMHGFECFDANLGCDAANDCNGRCGAGCSDDGTGTYRQDCADHDSCCRQHGGCLNPFDDCCGDEYREAADDFLFGDTNCEDCLDNCVMTLTAEPATLHPGEELAFEVYLHHRRLETVTQAFRMRFEAPDGEVLKVWTSQERTLEHGDEVTVANSVRLPFDLAPGIYVLRVGMDGMEQGLAERWVEITVEE